MKLTFTINDLSNEEALANEIDDLAKRVTDKPGLRPRTDKEREDCCAVGLLLEAWYLQNGATRGAKYADVILNGKRIELKTIKSESLGEAVSALDNSRSATADEFHVWVANRDTGVYSFYRKFDWSTKKAIR